MKPETRRWRLGRAFALLALCGGWLLSAGCATKITMEAAKIEIAANVNPDTGALIEKKTRFYATDPKVVAWVEFKQAHGEHTARFRWLNPEGQVVLDSGPVPVTDNPAMLYPYRRVWSEMPIANEPASMMPGTWKVEFLFDNRKFETRKFSIK